jgi:para-nitrobenzyl esterase
MSYWTNFAKTGNPNGKGLPHWPAYTQEEDRHMELGDEIKSGVNLYNQECDLIEKIQVNMLKSVN